MQAVRVISVCLVCVSLAGTASADVTIKQKLGGKSMMGPISGESVQYIKGLKMRNDMKLMGADTSTILDAATRQMVVLNHTRREAEVYDLTRMTADISKVTAGDMKASITPTKATRQVAGSTCTVYDMRIAVPMDMKGEKLEMVMAGPVCLVKNGPGQADYAAFYQAAAEKGLFVGDPGQARAQPAQARAMTEMYRQMAALGVPFANEYNITFEGSGQLAGMMSKMGGTTMTSELTSASTETLADSMFAIPAGYKVTNR
jgi:hypothetical protein